MKQLYTPPDHILRNYAQVLVNFGLNSGNGVKPGEVVECSVPDVAKPLALKLQNVILESGAHPIIRLTPTEFERDFFQRATTEQLAFFPHSYLRAKSKLIDHQIGIIAQVNPQELAGVDPKKIFLARNSKNKYREWLFKKEYEGKFTWTIGLWGEATKASIVGLSLKEYWQQIISACFLDQSDPVTHWKEIASLQQSIRKKLNDLEISSLYIEGEGVELTVQLGKERAWLGGGGRNIPSFELFTSPDWRGTNGRVSFNQPLYRYGHIISGVSLEFKNGVISTAHALQGNEMLQEMLTTKNANKIGEFSLTDKRMSRITHPMAETLFDENIGGPFGNMHLAIGMAYKDAFKGEPAKMSKKEWAQLGYNDSPEHTDIVSTTNRTVTATHKGGKTVIYQDGEFVI